MFDCLLSDTPPPFNCHSSLVCVCVHEEGRRGGGEEGGVEQDIMQLSMERKQLYFVGWALFRVRINKV